MCLLQPEVLGEPYPSRQHIESLGLLPPLVLIRGSGPFNTKNSPLCLFKLTFPGGRCIRWVLLFFSLLISRLKISQRLEKMEPSRASKVNRLGNKLFHYQDEN